MRQRVIFLGFGAVGVLATAIGCAGADEPDDTMVAPSGSAVSPIGSTTGASSSSSSSSSVSPTTTSAASSSASSTSSNATSTSTGGSTSSAAQTSEAGLSFTSDVHPILVAKCGDGFLCHDDGGTMAKYASATVATAFEAATKDMAKIKSRTQAGTMPVAEDLSTMCLSGGGPDTTKPTCLSTAELELIAAWVDAGGPE
jgi:hypothetical protein